MKSKLPILSMTAHPPQPNETVKMHSYTRRSKLDWSYQEIETLFDKHQELGNRWTIIAKYLPNKTENIIKNFFYSSLRKLIRKIKMSTMPSCDDKSGLTFVQYQHLVDYLENVLTCKVVRKSYNKKKEMFIQDMLEEQEVSIDHILEYKANMYKLLNTETQSWNSILSVDHNLQKKLELQPIHEQIQNKLQEILSGPQSSNNLIGNTYIPTNITLLPIEGLH